jgi:acetaldehyde dehydrogenase
MSDKLNVAVLGAGLTGIDLVEKLQRSAVLQCGLVVGRDRRTRGLQRAAEMGCATAASGIVSLMDHGETFDVVFDASNAHCHAEHWSYLKTTDAILVDLTPSRIGTMVVPTVNGRQALTHRHVNLVSCGGQASIPILHAIARYYRPEYIEVVTTGASYSAGRATRLNLDEYIETTQAAIGAFTGAGDVKVMTNISPARPAPPFRVVMTLLTSGAEAGRVRSIVETAAREVRGFTPRFEVTSCSVRDGKITVAVEVTAEGGRMPRYAGNLEIINSAAVLLAEKCAAARAAA